MPMIISYVAIDFSYRIEREADLIFSLGEAIPVERAARSSQRTSPAWKAPTSARIEGRFENSGSC